MMRSKKKREKYKGNSGFSIVEAVIALAILSIITLIVFQILNSSSRTYAKENADIQLQSEAQLVANSIKEVVMDCQNRVYFYDESNPYVQGAVQFKNALMIMNNDEQILIYENSEAGHEDELLFLKRKRGASGAFDTEFKTEEAELLAQYVSEFKVDLSRQAEENIVEFSFKYAFDSREYVGDYQVYMRNKVIVNADTNYDRDDSEAVVQVGVRPILWAIEPDRTNSQEIAAKKQFIADVKISGYLDRDVEWAISDTASNCSINQDGLLTVDAEPSIPQFKVIATSKADTSKSGAATVNVKKVTEITVQPVAGVTGMVDGVPSAQKNTKVTFTSTVSGWNIQKADQGVIWKLEYRPNYSVDSGYTTLTEFDATKGGYVHYNENVGKISAGGLLDIGKSAANNFEFRITATATFPNYGKPLTYKSASTLLRIKNEEVKFEGGFVRGVEVDLMAYFLSGQAALDGAVQSDVTEIKSFYKVTGSDGYEFDSDLLYFQDGKLYIDFDAFHYQNRDQFRQFYNSQTFHVWFYNQNDASMKMQITFPAVSLLKGTPEKKYIVLSKGSTKDIQFSYVGYNVTKAEQIGIYIDGEKVSSDGASSINRYLSSYLRTTTDSGESALGTRTKYVDNQKVRLAVSNADRYYPVGKIPYRITLDDFYQVSNMDARSYIEYDVYVANVQGQNLYIPGPYDAEGFPNVTKDKNKSYSVGPANTSVKMYLENNKYYMKYASRIYVYDEVYSYWKLK